MPRCRPRDREHPPPQPPGPPYGISQRSCQASGAISFLGLGQSSPPISACSLGASGSALDSSLFSLPILLPSCSPFFPRPLLSRLSALSLSLSPPPFLLPLSAFPDLPLFRPCCLPWPPSNGALPQKLQTLGPFPGASRGLITASQASHYQHHSPPHPQAPSGRALASILELSGMKTMRMFSVVGPRRGPTCIPYQSLLPSCLHSSIKRDHFRCRHVISAFQDPVGKKS